MRPARRLDETQEQVLQVEDDPLHRRLFQLFDDDDSGEISLREFIVGISPLAKGTVQVRALASAKGLDLAFLSHHLTACGARASSLLQDKLHFSFTLYDIDQTQQIKQACPRVPPRCVCIGRALSHAPPLSPCGAG